MRKRELDGSVVTFHAKQILNDKRVRERGNPGRPAVLSFNRLTMMSSQPHSCSPRTQQAELREDRESQALSATSKPTPKENKMREKLFGEL